MTKTCRNCGSEFSRDPKYSRKQWERAAFCSPACNSGQFNGRWNGGRTVTQRGYVVVFRPGHPMADALGRIYEHRLVASEELGRLLEPWEEVHHLNGDKGDNRPENLEVLHLTAHRNRHRKPGSRKRRHGEPNPVTVCACGCGRIFTLYDSEGRPRAYVRGHNSATKRYRQEPHESPRDGVGRRMGRVGGPMSTYVESPAEWDGVGRGVFLAGGITGCPDWQAEVVNLLDGFGLVLINPRRANFPIDDPSAAEAQITWEHRHLRRADLVSFWFPAATLCPIVLYELGAWSMTDKPIVVGVEPGYQRTTDVVIQTRLTRPDVHVVSSLDDLAGEIRRTA